MVDHPVADLGDRTALLGDWNERRRKPNPVDRVLPAEKRLDPGDLAGVVTREDLDKAIGHGLSHAPVKSVMTSSVVTCDAATPLAELQRLLASTDAGRVPVLDEGRVAGVVTRSDLLTAYGEAAEAPSPVAVSVVDRLRTLTERGLIFEAIQAVSGGVQKRIAGNFASLTTALRAGAPKLQGAAAAH